MQVSNSLDPYRISVEIREIKKHYRNSEDSIDKALVRVLDKLPKLMKAYEHTIETERQLTVDAIKKIKKQEGILNKHKECRQCCGVFCNNMECFSKRFGL